MPFFSFYILSYHPGTKNTKLEYTTKRPFLKGVRLKNQRFLNRGFFNHLPIIRINVKIWIADATKFGRYLYEYMGNRIIVYYGRSYRCYCRPVFSRKKYAEETGSAAGTDRGDETDRLHADNRQETDEDKRRGSSSGGSRPDTQTAAEFQAARR